MFSKITVTIFLVFFAIFLIGDVRGKGGRGGGRGGGGGGGRGGGSRGGGGGAGGGRMSGHRAGGSAYSGSAYRSSAKWSSVGAGLTAYFLMSSLSRSAYHRRDYYYHSNNRINNNNPSTSYGEECENNEDFNGTTFGKFLCPLPDFDPKWKYCCGENQTQFCCNHKEKFGYEDGEMSISGTLIFGVCVFLTMAIFSLLCFFRNRTIKNRNLSETRYSMRANSSLTMRPQNMSIRDMGNNNNFPMCNQNRVGFGFNESTNIPYHPNINHNQFRLPNSNPMIMPQMPTSYAPLLTDRPTSQYNSNMSPETHLNNYESKPVSYPEQISMPQPSFIAANSYSDQNVPPPSYTDVIKKTEQDKNNAIK